MMNKEELIEDFLKTFKPKEEQSWKSSYFFTHYLKIITTLMLSLLKECQE